jgi:hypothetical protein
MVLHTPPLIVGENVFTVKLCSTLVTHPLLATTPLSIANIDVEVPDIISPYPIVILYVSLDVVTPDTYGEHPALGPETTGVGDCVLVGVTVEPFFLTTVVPLIVPLPGP